MSEEDISRLIKQFSSVLNSQDIPDNLKNVLNNYNSSQTDTSSTNSNDSSENSMPNIDLEMLLKLKNIMDKINDKNDPRSNLLRSLKPYLNETRKNKVEQYIKFLNLSKILEALNSSGGDKID